MARRKSDNDATQVGGSLPVRADPVAGAVVGSAVFFAFLLGPVALLIWFIAWLVGRSGQRKPAEDREFAQRFHELERKIIEGSRPKPR